MPGMPGTRKRRALPGGNPPGGRPPVPGNRPLITASPGTAAARRPAGAREPGTGCAVAAPWHLGGLPLGKQAGAGHLPVPSLPLFPDRERPGGRPEALGNRPASSSPPSPWHRRAPPPAKQGRGTAAPGRCRLPPCAEGPRRLTSRPERGTCRPSSPLIAGTAGTPGLGRGPRVGRLPGCRRRAARTAPRTNHTPHEPRPARSTNRTPSGPRAPPVRLREEVPPLEPARS